MGILVLVISAAIVVLDQIFKYLAINNLKSIENIVVIDNLLYFTYLENRGAAFGIFSNQRWLFIIATVLAIILLVYLVFVKKFQSKIFNISVALIIGGGVGNLIDRIFLGYVVDYIEISFFPPVCNFADYCITAGTIILIIWLFFCYDKNKNS